MKTARVVLVTLAISLLAVPRLAAQEKNPGLAGLMSTVVPGAGSFYAGNGGHGVRHLTIAGLSALAARSGLRHCEIPFGDTDGCTVAAVSSVAFIANWIWAITVGVGDARRHNQYLATAGLHLAPELVALDSGGEPGVGLQLLQFTF